MENDIYPEKSNNKRETIPNDVKIFVWNRDNGKWYPLQKAG